MKTKIALFALLFAAQLNYGQTCNCPEGSIMIGQNQSSITVIDQNYTLLPDVAGPADGIICIQGKVILNRDQGFTNDCEIYMGPGASIEVSSNYRLAGTRSRFYACSNAMYKGIIVKPNARIDLFYCSINDAEIGLVSETNSTQFLYQDTFRRNFQCIDVKPNVSFSSGLIKACVFSGRFGFLPPYPGSPYAQAMQFKYWTHTGIKVMGPNALSISNCEFDLIRNGIFITGGSTVSINSNKFTDIFHWEDVDQNFTMPEGVAIWVDGNSVAPKIYNNTILEASVGLRTYNAGLLSVDNNDMKLLDAGIVETGSFINSRLVNNKIEFRKRGIWVTLPKKDIMPAIINNKLTINSVEFYIDQRDAIYLTGISTKFEGNVSEISENDIFLDGACNGIFSQSNNNLGITANIIKYDRPMPEQLSVSGIGINLRNTFGCQLQGNIVYSDTYSSSTSPLQGILASNSKINKYCCNVVRNAEKCFSFSGNCDKSIFRNNSSMGQYQNGLSISPGGFFGKQPDPNNPTISGPSGNQWLGITFQGLHQAKNTNSFIIKDMSQIKATDCTAPLWPLTIFPAQQCDNNGSNWFLSIQNPSFDCSVQEDPACIGSFLTGGWNNFGAPFISDFDETIAQDEFPNLPNKDGVTYDGQRDLFNLINSNLGLFNQSPAIDSFYFANTASNISKFSIIDGLGANIYSVALPYKTDLNDLNEILNDYYDQIEINAELLESANAQDSLIILNTIENLSNLIHTNRTGFTNILSQLEIALSAYWNTINIEFNNLTPTTVFESREYTVYKQLIKTYLINGYVLSSVDSSQIADIAELCPEIYGKTINWARLIMEYNYGLSYNDLNCGNFNDLLQSGNETSHNGNTNDEIKLEGTNSNNSTNNLLDYELINLTTGLRIIGFELNNNSRLMLTDKLTSGIYILITKNNGLIVSKKKVVIL